MISMARFNRLQGSLEKAGHSYSEGLVFESKYSYDDGYAFAKTAYYHKLQPQAR